MISLTLRMYLSIALIIYFTLILIFLRRKALSLKYTLLWIFSGLGLGILIVFPHLLEWITGIIDIKSAVNGLFAFCIFFILIILMSITSIVSKQSYKIKRLVQDNALLEKRIRELENRGSKEGDAL